MTKLIARRVRDLGVYAEIITPKELKKLIDYENIKGIILSRRLSKQLPNKNI